VSNIIFRCPITGMNVQHSISETTDIERDSIAAVACPACAGLHLLDLETGTLFAVTPDRKQ
jgi:hypothetical protein